MQTKTSQRTMPNITNITRVTEPKFGSDEYMYRRGYGPVSASDRSNYRRFVKREGFFTIIRGAIRRWVAQKSSPKRSDFAAWQIDGAISLSDRRSQAVSDIPQIVATQNEVFEERSGHWQRADLAETALQC